MYAAYRPGVRWSWKEYSDLQILDVQTGAERTLTHHTKYFSPDISEDGNQVVAVQVNPDGTNRLQLLDARSGLVTASLPNLENVFFTYRNLVLPVRSSLLCATPKGRCRSR